MSIDAERSPAVVGAENLCGQNPGLWDSADTPGRRAATKLCWQCPLFEACQRTLTAHVASGNVPREQVFAGVAFDGEGRIDPDVHSIEGAAALAASYDVPVGEGGFIPSANVLPLLTDDQIRDRLEILDKAKSHRPSGRSATYAAAV